MRRYAVLAGRAHGVPVTFTAPAVPALGRRVEAAFYRVGQEALHNALRHSGATKVSVGLARSGRQFVLEVSDNGHGFVPDLAPKARGGSGPPPQAARPAGSSPPEPAESGGVGLASMRERAAAVGGKLTVRSGQAGTVVRLAVPLRGGECR
jgi:two-component system sensor histidine kinase UhpB